jgi:hypothetical protein
MFGRFFASWAKSEEAMANKAKVRINSFIEAESVSAPNGRNGSRTGGTSWDVNHRKAFLTCI